MQPLGLVTVLPHNKRSVAYTYKKNVVLLGTQQARQLVWFMLLSAVDPQCLTIAGVAAPQIGVMYEARVPDIDNLHGELLSSGANWILRTAWDFRFRASLGDMPLNKLPAEQLCLIPASLGTLHRLDKAKSTHLGPAITACKKQRTRQRLAAAHALGAAARALLGRAVNWPRDMTREIVLWAWPRLLWRQI